MNVIAQVFVTEAGFDFLCVDSMCISGDAIDGYYQRDGAIADLSWIAVTAGSIITWSSDYSITRLGFQMCRGTPPPSSPPPAPLSPLPPGTLLDFMRRAQSSRRRFISLGALQWVSLRIRSSSGMTAILVIRHQRQGTGDTC